MKLVAGMEEETFQVELRKNTRSAEKHQSGATNKVKDLSAQVQTSFAWRKLGLEHDDTCSFRNYTMKIPHTDCDAIVQESSRCLRSSQILKKTLLDSDFSKIAWLEGDIARFQLANIVWKWCCCRKKLK